MDTTRPALPLHPSDEQTIAWLTETAQQVHGITLDQTPIRHCRYANDVPKAITLLGTDNASGDPRALTTLQANSDGTTLWTPLRLAPPREGDWELMIVQPTLEAIISPRLSYVIGEMPPEHVYTIGHPATAAERNRVARAMIDYRRRLDPDDMPGTANEFVSQVIPAVAKHAVQQDKGRPDGRILEEAPTDRVCRAVEDYAADIFGRVPRLWYAADGWTARLLRGTSQETQRHIFPAALLQCGPYPINHDIAQLCVSSELEAHGHRASQLTDGLCEWTETYATTPTPPHGLTPAQFNATLMGAMGYHLLFSLLLLPYSSLHRDDLESRRETLIAAIDKLY
jgi:hypothetical protein